MPAAFTASPAKSGGDPMEATEVTGGASLLRVSCVLAYLMTRKTEKHNLLQYNFFFTVVYINVCCKVFRVIFQWRVDGALLWPYLYEIIVDI